MKSILVGGISTMIPLDIFSLPKSIITNENLNDLKKGFINPPNLAKPLTWWHWMNGHISRKAITRDLEAMKQNGIGGFTLFNASEGTPPGPVKYMSDEWWEMIKHTISESERLGLTMGIHNGPGWSTSGGPWVKPNQAMQELVWTEKQLTGPSEFDGLLDKPRPALGIERDMARDPEINKRYYVPRKKVKGYYRDIAVMAFPTPTGEQAANPFRIENWRAKSGFTKMNEYSMDKRKAPVNEIIDPKKIVDLTSELDDNGRLKWKVPEGDWTVIRFGYQPTGRENHPAPLGGRGLEVDKLTSEAVDAYWKNSLAKIIQISQRENQKILKNILIDSFEAGHQNWKANFDKVFHRLRGYSLLRYLPSLTGRVVGDMETSEKFLWDFRKTLSDMITENYYGRLEELCKKNGLNFSCEPYGRYGNTDDLAVAGTPQIPMTEWWAFRNRTSDQENAKLVASASHAYGRRIAGAEAFTGPPNRIFEAHPGALKSQGDYFLCQGINQFHLHTFTHDPYGKVPGLGLGAYGSRFDRRNTWWSYTRPWMNYMARCQYMLQQGEFVADILYYAGEDAPKSAKAGKKLTPPPPLGFDYDICNREILDKVDVQGGRIIIPSGMSYRMLVLPDKRHMRPEVLLKIEELAAGGATVIGPKPFRVPGLEGGKRAETQLKNIADRLWDKCDGKSVTANVYGKGRIYWGQGIEEICNEFKLLPDFTFRVTNDENFEETKYPGTGLEYIHRRTEKTDIYFISNQHDQFKIVEAKFRINSRLPELWDPENGRTEVASEFQEFSNGRMMVTLRLKQSSSIFVIFRKPLKNTTGIVSVEQNKKPADIQVSRTDNQFFLQTEKPGYYDIKFTDKISKTVHIPKVPEPIRLTDPWKISFPTGWGAPKQINLHRIISWTKHTNPGIKYFSGTATYYSQIEVPSKILSETYKNILDLGNVEVIAEVLINGKSCGVIWKKPFKIDITKYLRTGVNDIQIRVANLWINRLIGDQQYSDECEWTSETGTTANGLGLKKIPEWVVNNKPRQSTNRKLFVSWKWPHLKEKELLPSGLLGPVRIITEVKRKIG